MELIYGFFLNDYYYYYYYYYYSQGRENKIS